MTCSAAFGSGRYLCVTIGDVHMSYKDATCKVSIHKLYEPYPQRNNIPYLGTNSEKHIEYGLYIHSLQYHRCCENSHFRKTRAAVSLKYKEDGEMDNSTSFKHEIGTVGSQAH